MMRLLRAAMKGVRAEIASPGGAWSVVNGSSAPLAGPALQSAAGPVVSAETILNLSTVWACTSATAQLVASLPCGLYERDGGGGKRKIDDQLSEAVFWRPNQVQTGVEFWEGMILQQLVKGNAYARKLKIGNRIVGLEPMFGVTPERKDGRFQYRVKENGRPGTRTLTSDDVLHTRGFGAGEGLGLSVVRHGVNSFGAALAADQSAAKVFQNGLQPSGVLQTEQVLQPEQRKQLQAILDRYTGSDKAGKAMVLEAGLSWQSVQWNPEDAQLLGTRQFQVEDICRWFGIPPVVIGHAAQGQTMWGSGVEMVMLSWLQTGINPLLRRIEARMNVDLIPANRRRQWFFEFNREAMLQMDSKAKAQFLSQMATSGTMTANERRAKLNLPPHADPAADSLLAQTALTLLEHLSKEGSDAA